jgi:DNA-binding NarL/FixJ family response regulator
MPGCVNRFDEIAKEHGKTLCPYFMRKNRILIIEDNRILRDGITTMLKEKTDMLVVAAVESADTILLKTIKIKPHVILVDVGLKGLNGSSVIGLLREKFPEVKVIGIGCIPTQSNIVEFVEAGASGFILKDATAKEFLEVIRSVAQGAKVLPPSLTGSLFSFVVELALKKGNGTITNTVRMTKREHEIMLLIADGMSNKEIAHQLNIATHTVKSHVHNIMEKSTVHTRFQIAKFTHEENS